MQQLVDNISTHLSGGAGAWLLLLPDCHCVAALAGAAAAAAEEQVAAHTVATALAAACTELHDMAPSLHALLALALRLAAGH